MAVSLRSRNVVALILCSIAVFAFLQASGTVPRAVSAANTISIQLLRSSTEPSSSSGVVEVDLDNGQVSVDLHQATPSSVYTAVFVSSAISSNIQIGTFATDSQGEGTLKAKLNSGSYVGFFDVTRLGLMGSTSAFASASTTFTIGASASGTLTISSTTTSESASTNQTSETSESQNTVSANNSTQFKFEVEPVSMSIMAGDFAKYNIHIMESSSADIFLVARNVPPGSVAIFTPNVDVANPEFNSKLTIVTSANTPAGNYNVTIVALINGEEFNAQIALDISTSTTSVSPTMTVSGASVLSISVTTDQSQYQPNATITVQGHVTDDTGSAVEDASVSVQVDSPTGSQAYFTNSAHTDPAGSFTSQFTLQANAAAGTYAVFTSASKSGYSGAAARTSFIVGTPSAPSVIISTVYTGDSSGNPTSTFSLGQTVFIWVVIQNIGSTFKGVIWVQVEDPSGIPVKIEIDIEPLQAGESLTKGIGFVLSGNVPLGIYHVDALVSDKLISQGGTFLATAQAQFALTS